MSDSAEHIPLEIELKLAFPPDARARVEAHPAFDGPGAAGPKSARYISTYFDTSDLALARAGLSLRVRTRDGRRMQTLKFEGNATGAAAQRGEWEWAVRSDRPDTTLLVGTPAATYADATLEPVMVTDIQRTTRMLKLEHGATVEAAIDEGTIRASGQERAVHELELELKDGSPAALFELGLALQADLPLTLEAESKASRGFSLRTGHPPAPRKTPQPALQSDVGAAEGFRLIVDAAVGALIANQPAAAAGDPEGVHQMRIAVRRLRTALVLFKPHLEPAPMARFEAELRRLGQVLGEARDWDVFTLDTLPAALKDGLSSELQPAAEAERQAALGRMREEFARPDLTRLILGLAAWTTNDALSMQEPVRHSKLADLAPALLDRLARKVVKRGRRIRKLSATELHGVRKSLKKLRYAVDDVSALFPKKRVKSFRKHCAGMQDELGIINDAAMAVTLSQALANGGGPQRSQATDAAARWGEKRRHKALKKLPDDWQAFREAGRFWR